MNVVSIEYVIQPDVGSAGHVWVEVDVVGVEVVLHDVLVDPVDLRAPDPVLAQPQQPVHVGVSAHGPVIGIVLDVEPCWKCEKWSCFTFISNVCRFFTPSPYCKSAYVTSSLNEVGKYFNSLNFNLTYESGQKAHGNHEMNGVVAVVVTVDL